MTNPLTDSQLEAAARKLCELRGVDPDDSDAYDGHYHQRPADLTYWELAARELRAADQIRIALEHGRQQ